MKGMNTLKIVLFLGLAGALTARSGRPQSACMADMEKFCGQFKGKRAEMRQCVKSNKDKFSAECRAQKEQIKGKRAERREKMAKARQVCAADAEKFCAATQNAPGKKKDTLKCLMANRDQLSEACRAALPQKRVRKEK